MRRPLAVFIVAVVAAGLTAGTVTLASAGGGPSASEQRVARAKDRSSAERRGHRGGHRGMHRLFVGIVTKSLAGRLGVEPAALRKAAREVGKEQWAARLKAAGLSDAEIAALKACHRGGHAMAGRHGAKARNGARTRSGAKARRRAARRAARRGTCDRPAARAAMKKLKAAPKPDLAALKTEIATALATKLSLTPEKVLEATRAELVQRVDQAVAMSFVTAKGRDLALGCFDTPATCDLKALKREVRFGEHKRRG